MREKRRRLRLVLPRIQIRLMLAFGGITVLALLLQHLLFLRVLSDMIAGVQDDGGTLVQDMHSISWRLLAGAFGLLLPVVILVGIAVTHRWCGPLYRMQQFLRETDQGNQPADCKLRQGDELTDFCDLINRTTRLARSQQSAPPQIEANSTRSAA